MKCTDCSRVMKPVVAVDIDGTLGNYHGHLYDFVLSYFGLGYGRETLWDGTGNYEDWIGITQEQYREAKLAFRQGGMKRTMHCYDGAPQIVKNFRSAGAEVWITTTRPWNRLDSVDPDTREWLRRNNIEFDHLLYGDEKYQDLVNIVGQYRICAVVDDLPEQFDIARNLSLPVIQRENYHNSGPGLNRIPRGKLVTVHDWVINQIDNWYKENGRDDDKR